MLCGRNEKELLQIALKHADHQDTDELGYCLVLRGKVTDSFIAEVHDLVDRPENFEQGILFPFKELKVSSGVYSKSYGLEVIIEKEEGG